MNKKTLIEQLEGFSMVRTDDQPANKDMYIEQMHSPKNDSGVIKSVQKAQKAQKATKKYVLNESIQKKLDSLGDPMDI